MKQKGNNSKITAVKYYLESQTRPEEFTRKVIKSGKVKKPKKTSK